MFRPDLLPVPKVFWEREIGRLTRPNRNGWAQGRSPFRKSKSGRSFSVNLSDGSWHDFGSDLGGDMIAFVRLRYSLSFREANKYLGADDEKPYKRLPTVPRRVLLLDFVIDGVPYRAEVNDEPKSDLERMRWIHTEAADRLKALRDGDREQFENEGEVQWGILSASWELIQSEVGR